MIDIDVGSVLKQLRRSKQMTVADLEIALKEKLSYHTLTRMESKNKTVSIPQLQILADFYNVSVTDIIRAAENKSDLDPEIAQYHRVPILSWVQAGEWTESPDPSDFSDNSESVIAPTGTSENCFALKVKGESMQSPIGMSFPDGCIIFVDPNKQPNNGSFVIARYEDSGECTFKKLVIDGPNKILRALNPDFPPIQINGNAVITGVVTGMQWACSHP